MKTALLAAMSLAFAAPALAQNAPTIPALPANAAVPSVAVAAPPGAPVVSSPPKAATPVVVKPALAANLQPLLPGTDLTAAAQGFRNLGAFVSAVHVSHNLEIPFASLKTRIVTDGMSLGSAIQSFKPAANVKTEVARAEKQAKDTIAKGNAQ